MDTDISDITILIRKVEMGDLSAQEELFQRIYFQLKSLARHRLIQMSSGSTMKATELVHEFYLKVFKQGGKGPQHIENRRHFFCLASRAMRQILTDEYRKKMAAKREGPKGEEGAEEPIIGVNEDMLDYQALDQALEELQKVDERKVKIVELRYYGGLNNPEIAQMLDLSLNTVKRDITFAMAFLHKKMY